MGFVFTESVLWLAFGCSPADVGWLYGVGVGGFSDVEGVAVFL